MNYRKPELVELPRAADVVHGISKTSVFMDSSDPNHALNSTAAAYEADE